MRAPAWGGTTVETVRGMSFGNARGAGRRGHFDVAFADEQLGGVAFFVAQARAAGERFFGASQRPLRGFEDDGVGILGQIGKDRDAIWQDGRETFAANHSAAPSRRTRNSPGSSSVTSASWPGSTSICPVTVWSSTDLAFSLHAIPCGVTSVSMKPVCATLITASSTRERGGKASVRLRPQTMGASGRKSASIIRRPKLQAETMLERDFLTPAEVFDEIAFRARAAGRAVREHV